MNVTSIKNAALHGNEVSAQAVDVSLLRPVTSQPFLYNKSGGIAQADTARCVSVATTVIRGRTI